MKCRDNYALEILNKDGDLLDQLPVSPNWEPALEWVWLQAMRRAPQPVTASGREPTIEPVPHSANGSPYCSGFRVTLNPGSGGPIRCDFPVRYFHEDALRASAALVQKGKLAAGENFLYRLIAFPPANPEPAAATPFMASQSTVLPRMESGSLNDLRRDAHELGDSEPGDVDIFIPQQVLDEADELTLKAGPYETGGILIGYVMHDKSLPDIGVVVTAQIPVRHAEAERTRITFTADSWASARAAIALRKREEIMVGFWHTHPSRYWCAPSCPIESRRVCPLHRNFFSADDVQFHTTMFPKAYTAALVITHTDDGLKQAMFGWRTGRMVQRGFHILNPGDRLPKLAENNQTSNDNEPSCS